MGKHINKANMQVKYDMYTALLGLLKKHNISTIGVSELTEEAGVSRMAFYRNYNTIEDILKEHLEIMFMDYAAEDAKTEESEIYCAYHYMIHCLKFFLKHHELMDALISCGMGDMVLARITEYLIQKWTPDPEKKADQMKMCVFAGAIYNIYREWAKREFRESPEELAEILSTIQS